MKLHYAIIFALFTRRVTSQTYTTADASGYSCLQGTLGVTPQATHNACVNSVYQYYTYLGGWTADSDARNQGCMPGSDSGGKYCLLRAHAQMTVHGVQGCTFAITNTGQADYKIHYSVNKYLPGFIMDRCPKFGPGQTNVQPGDYGSFGGRELNPNSKIQYDLLS